MLDSRNTKSRSLLANERRLAQNRVADLSPIVTTWIDKTEGDSELVLSVSYQTDNGSLVSDNVSIFITSSNQLPLAVVSQTAPETLPSTYNDTVTLSAEESSDPDENGQINSSEIAKCRDRMLKILDHW